MKRFIASQDGVVAVIFAIIAIPFIALGGWGVDYLRLYHVRDAMQVHTDAAVLNAMVENADPDAWRGVMEARLEAQYGADGWADNLAIDGEWINGSDFRVTAQADVPLTFMHLIPGVPPTQRVSVEATGRLTEPTLVYDAPEFADLDPEAGDYNRIWLYCYWPGRPEGVIDAPKRTQMVPIADNGGSDFTIDPGVNSPSDAELAEELQQKNELYTHGIDGVEDGVWRVSEVSGQRNYLYFMPRCQSGSYLSYRLENVRAARTNMASWDGGGDRYDYFTDSEMVMGQQETYHDLTHPHTGVGVDILETVLCDTKQDCEQLQSAGGAIPSGKNRTPERAAQGCSSGKYMYYGWEDRPPGQAGPAVDWNDYAWTDSDYDDIRIVIKCPVEVLEGERVARLIS